MKRLALLLGILLAVAACDGMYRVVIPCSPDSARGTPADTIIPCDALRDTTWRRQ